MLLMVMPVIYYMCWPKKLFASLNTKRQATAVNDAHTHTLTIKCQAKAASECGRDVLSLSFRSVFD